jgi:hypothetical protein
MPAGEIQFIDNVKLWIENLENAGTVFKLQYYMFVAPISILAFPILKIMNKW